MTTRKEALEEMPPPDFHEREFWRWCSKHYKTIRAALESPHSSTGLERPSSKREVSGSSPDAEALLPCPFCNEKPVFRDGVTGCYISCKDCEVKTGLVHSGSLKRTIKAWNTRALPPPPDEVMDTIWEAWHEINAICARDGAPQGVCPEYFANLKDRLKDMLPEKYQKPWHPRYVREKRNHIQGWGE